MIEVKAIKDGFMSDESGFLSGSRFCTKDKEYEVEYYTPNGFVIVDDEGHYHRFPTNNEYFEEVSDE